jgi:DNA-directed RNA polymerase subunit RPC12/RpoP
MIKKKNEIKKEIKCSYCHNEYIYEDEDLIDVDESHLGFICPECGNQIIVKEISYTDFPDSFWHYDVTEGARKLTDKQIQNMVNSVVRKLKEMKDNYGYFYTSTGDTIVFGVKIIDDGENHYDIYVARNYYSTSF